MIVRPMLGDWEIPRIESIAAIERRRIARFGVPGLHGDLQQDLGTTSLAVEIVGSVHGDEARDTFLEAVREKYRDGSPLTFVADIVTATELEEVVIESLDVVEVNDGAIGACYRMVLREYVEPPPPPSPFEDLGADLLPDLGLLAELGLDGLELPGMLGAVPELGDPVAPIMPALDAVEEAVGALPAALDGVREALGL